MTFCPDPRPLAPPDDPPPPDPEPVWHFIASDGHEDYVLTEDEITDVTQLYVSAGVPYTVIRGYRD